MGLRQRRNNISNGKKYIDDLGLRFQTKTLHLPINDVALSVVENDNISENYIVSENIAFLSKFGISQTVLWETQQRAMQYSIDPAQAFLHSGHMTEENYFRCMALELELPFIDRTVASGQPFYNVPDQQSLHDMSRTVLVNSAESERRGFAGARGRAIHFAPDSKQMQQIRSWLENNPELRQRLHITSHTTNRNALKDKCALSLTNQAVTGLETRFPSLSARQVISIPQALLLFLALQIVLGTALFGSAPIVLILHLASAFFYLGCIGLRFHAAWRFDPRRRFAPERFHIDRSQDHKLPVYTLLIPLYREANQVTALAKALRQLDWPVERLEIKLICEADDLDTLEACRKVLRKPGHHHFEIVAVPPGNPRTKPKALNYALPLSSGAYVVIYDAEDRPHPLQLREAWSRFQAGPENLACLQAPLVIHNSFEGWLPRMFATEYAALFDGLLPYLARLRAPLPLGGTSNHLKRSILDICGGWDAFNVTEDADLGMRIARSGYLTGTLRAPTFEEASVELSVWLKQRTRWFKGWYQTWLIHMRNPLLLSNDLGFVGMLVFQIMMAGLAVSALVHPILIYFIIAHVVDYLTVEPGGSAFGPLFWLDVLTVLFGYFSFGWLAWQALPIRGLEQLRGTIWGIPAYWMLLSVAAWRALCHLITRSHDWEKTPHRLRDWQAPRHRPHPETGREWSPIA